MEQSTAEPTTNPILVAVDLSDRTTACLAHGCRLAAKLRQPLILLHVVHESGETLGMYRRHPHANVTTPNWEIARTMLEERVAAFRSEHDDCEGVGELRSVVVEGLPQTRIPEFAAHCGADMLVMCSHIRRGLRHWLHGSVTEAVARHAPCPVVVVGREDDQRFTDVVPPPGLGEAYPSSPPS